MKNKAFVALLCAMAMCMPLAACGENDETPAGGTEGGTQTEQGGSQQGGGEQSGSQQGGNQQGGTEQSGEQQPALTENTDFDALVSDKVTEEQWDAAFSDEAFAGVTVKLSENSNTRLVKYGYERNGDDFSVMKDAEDLSRGSGQNTIYCFKSDAIDTYFKFKGNDRPPYCEEDVWYLETHEKDSEGWNGIHSETSMQWGNTFRGLVAYDFAGKFSEFTYDEEQGAYTFTGAMEIKYTPMEARGGYTVSYATLKFSGGKLAYAKVKVTNGDEEVYNYYDYGKTKIVVPTDTLPMPEE